MVDVGMSKINTGLFVVALLAYSVTSIEKTETNMDDVMYKDQEKSAIQESEGLPTCDVGNDPTCSDPDTNQIYRASNPEQDITVTEHETVDKYGTVNEGEMFSDNTDTSTNTQAAKAGEMTAGQTQKSEESDKMTGHMDSEYVNVNSTSNSSTVLQWFKYVMEQFLEEFKDGIYSKQPEPLNTTEVNQSLPIVNETIESDAENKTELVESLSSNKTVPGNATDSKKVKFHCTGRNITDNSNATVKLITSARLLQLLNFDKNETENMTDCLLVMFYAPWCHFCARTAPNYNAVARAYPQLDFVAVDTAQFSNLLARFGTVSVPNILIFHQSRAAVKFNQTERNFENLVSFIHNATGLEPNTTVNVTEADFAGPVPSVPTDDPDYLLLISWIFVIFCSSCMFVKSQKGQQWITRIRILWQEHQHID